MNARRMFRCKCYNVEVPSLCKMASSNSWVNHVELLFVKCYFFISVLLFNLVEVNLFMGSVQTTIRCV